MIYHSTPFISYSDIDTSDVDLFEDACGFNIQYVDVISLIKSFRVKPSRQLTRQLILKIEQALQRK